MKGVRVNIFWGNWDQCLVNCELNFWQKKEDPLINIQFSYQSLRHSIVYINENRQPAIIFNNLGILTLVGTWIKNYIFPWQSTGDIRSIIWVRFFKTSQTCGLCICQLEKLTAFLYGSDIERKTKIKIL